MLSWIGAMFIMSSPMIWLYCLRRISQCSGRESPSQSRGGVVDPIKTCRVPIHRPEQVDGEAELAQRNDDVGEEAHRGAGAIDYVGDRVDGGEGSVVERLPVVPAIHPVSFAVLIE